MSTRLRYPTDLTDAEWRLLGPLVPAPKSGGRPATVDRRELLNAIFYIVRSGQSWRMLPHDLPKWKTVNHYFRQWRDDGTWERLNAALRTKVRAAAGKGPQASAGVMDSQSVKTTQKRGTHGYDAGKQVNGRKRHLLVDTLGLVLAVAVTAASVTDRNGAKVLLGTGEQPWARRMERVWADSAYAGPELEDWVFLHHNCLLEIVPRSERGQGFVLEPHRWTVERTFGWFGQYRRLSKDYEYRTASSTAMVHIAMINLMVRRLARGGTTRWKRKTV